MAPPQVPQRIGRAEQITLSYGHGIAVAPLQVAAAAATILNGGERVTPTFLRRAEGAAVLSAASRRQRGNEQDHERAVPPQRHGRAWHGQAGRRGGLPRRRQDGHGRASRPRRL